MVSFRVSLLGLLIALAACRGPNPAFDEPATESDAAAATEETGAADVTPVDPAPTTSGGAANPAGQRCEDDADCSGMPRGACCTELHCNKACHSWCEGDEDCPPTTRCAYGYCLYECTDDEQCSWLDSGFKCVLPDMLCVHIGAP